MYYGMIMASVLMFSLQFFFNQKFTKRCGDSMAATLLFAGGSSAAGLIVLLIINQFRLSVSPFAFIMACLTTLNNLLYTFCSMKSLGKINLSLYSVFAMLGGMVLPFIAGVAFFDEDLTAGKILCVAIIAVALVLTLPKKKPVDPNAERPTKQKNYNWLWYAGIFVLNGMSGVLAKIYQAAPYAPKPDEASFSILCAAVTAVVALIAFFCVGGHRLRVPLASAVDLVGNGTLSRVANYLLLIALLHVPASVQYPMITGGVMIFSTVISFLTGQKPSRGEVAAVAVAFVGILALVLFP